MNHLPPQQQNTADMLKGIVDRAAPGDARRQALESVQVFESAAWQPQLFIDLLPETLTFDNRGRLTYAGNSQSAPGVISEFLARYTEQVE